MRLKRKFRPLTIIVSAGFTATAAAQKPIAYPSKGRSVAPQKQDDGECYVRAKDSTGVDPAQPPQTQSGPGVNASEARRPAPSSAKLQMMTQAGEREPVRRSA